MPSVLPNVDRLRRSLNKISGVALDRVDSLVWDNSELAFVAVQRRMQALQAIHGDSNSIGEEAEEQSTRNATEDVTNSPRPTAQEEEASEHHDQLPIPKPLPTKTTATTSKEKTKAHSSQPQPSKVKTKTHASQPQPMSSSSSDEAQFLADLARYTAMKDRQYGRCNDDTLDGCRGNRSDSDNGGSHAQPSNTASKTYGDRNQASSSTHQVVQEPAGNPPTTAQADCDPLSQSSTRRLQWEIPAISYFDQSHPHTHNTTDGRPSRVITDGPTLTNSTDGPKAINTTDGTPNNNTVGPKRKNPTHGLPQKTTDGRNVTNGLNPNSTAGSDKRPSVDTPLTNLQFSWKATSLAQAADEITLEDPTAPFDAITLSVDEEPDHRLVSTRSPTPVCDIISPSSAVNTHNDNGGLLRLLDEPLGNDSAQPLLSQENNTPSQAEVPIGSTDTRTQYNGTTQSGSSGDSNVENHGMRNTQVDSSRWSINTLEGSRSQIETRIDANTTAETSSSRELNHHSRGSDNPGDWSIHTNLVGTGEEQTGDSNNQIRASDNAGDNAGDWSIHTNLASTSEVKAGASHHGKDDRETQDKQERQGSPTDEHESSSEEERQTHRKDVSRRSGKKRQRRRSETDHSDARGKRKRRKQGTAVSRHKRRHH